MEELSDLIVKKIKKGMKFDNPQKGTSTIIFVSENQIKYKRGKSTIKIKMKDIIEVHEKFSGTKCTSNDLKTFRKEVFSSKDNGHSCNCTFFFILLNYLGFASNIEGRGVRGNPYYVNLK